MSEKYYAYETVIEREANRFDAEVCVLLEEGWELHGNPYVITLNQSDDPIDHFCQALTITKENFRITYVGNDDPDWDKKPEKKTKVGQS